MYEEFKKKAKGAARGVMTDEDETGEPIRQTVLSPEDIAHGTYNGRGFYHDTKTCAKPECQRDQCRAARGEPPVAPDVRTPEYVSFPVDLLPEPIASFVQQLAVAIGCDPSYAALPALAVAASTIGNTRVIQLKRDWREPSVVWSATVGDSGTMKSPALAKVLDPLHERQAANLVDWRDKMVVFEQRLAQHKASARAAAQGGAEPAPLPKEPNQEKVICSDVTIEKLAEILEDNPRGILVARDELAGWFGSFTKYKSNGGTDLPQWLEMFSAKQIMVDRKGGNRKSVYVRHAAVSITGTIQPGTLARALTPEALEAGLGARVLMAMPPKTLKHWSEVEVHPDCEDAYSTMIDRLLSLGFNQGLDGKGHKPHILKLSPDAKAAFIEFFDAMARRQLAATGCMVAILPKLVGYAGRLALIHHVASAVRVDDDDRTPVGLDSMQAGIGLALWFAAEAERIEAKMGDGAQERRLRRLAEKIRDKGGHITARDLGRLQFDNDAKAGELALDAMVRAGLGKWEDKPAGSKGGRPTKLFRLNPGAG